MRGACFRLGKHERAVGKIECRKNVAARGLRSGLPPMQPAGDHQVQHEPKIAVEADGDALADAPQFTHGAALDARQRRIGRAQEKHACDPHVLEDLTDDARLERA